MGKEQSRLFRGFDAPEVKNKSGSEASIKQRSSTPTSTPTLPSKSPGKENQIG
jgi:hypothetical protein